MKRSAPPRRAERCDGHAVWGLVGVPIALASFILAARQFNGIALQRAGLWNIGFALVVLAALSMLRMQLTAIMSPQALRVYMRQH